MGLLALRTNTFNYWKEETAIRRLSEIIPFLHKRASSDGVYYRLDFKYGETCSYTINQMLTYRDYDTSMTEGIGNLSLEISGLQNPTYADENTLIPPQNFPSLSEPVELPNSMCFSEIKTMHGNAESSNPENAFMVFSPQSFSEFAVIHLILEGKRDITILVNPFTGTTKIFREFKDFEWSYGR